ncbi:MAG: hypothetical protein WC443_08730 [Desulfobaccales bacterium]
MVQSFFGGLPVHRPNMQLDAEQCAYELRNRSKTAQQVVDEVQSRAAGRIFAALVAMLAWHDARILADALEPLALDAEANHAQLQQRREAAEAAVKEAEAAVKEAAVRVRQAGIEPGSSGGRGGARGRATAVRMRVQPTPDEQILQGAWHEANLDLAAAGERLTGVRRELAALAPGYEALTHVVRDLRALPGPEKSVLELLKLALADG